MPSVSIRAPGGRCPRGQAHRAPGRAVSATRTVAVLASAPARAGSATGGGGARGAARLRHRRGRCSPGRPRSRAPGTALQHRRGRWLRFGRGPGPGTRGRRGSGRGTVRGCVHRVCGPQASVARQPGCDERGVGIELMEDERPQLRSLGAYGGAYGGADGPMVRSITRPVPGCADLPVDRHGVGDQRDETGAGWATNAMRPARWACAPWWPIPPPPCLRPDQDNRSTVRPTCCA